MNIFHSLKKIAFQLGFDVRRVRSSQGLRSTLSESYIHLKKMGFQPNVIFDVGVASGTFELYNAFPESFMVLLEPVMEFEPAMRSITKKFRGIYILAAAGSYNRQVELNVHRHQLEGSSILKETMGTFADGYSVNVPMVRIDDVAKENGFYGPYFLKVDVQGNELDVLIGSNEILLDTEVVVLEVSMFQFHKGGPQFYDVVDFLKQINFVAYDIILGWNRPLDNALGQIDIVFVKEDGFFRQNHSYATQHQMAKLFRTQE